MKFYNFTFSSKNKKSLKFFFITFFNSESNLNSKVIKAQFQKKKKKKFITILKSPHVNKSAQEQFEFKHNFKQLSIYQPKGLKYLYFLKKIKNNGLSDIKIKTKFSFNINKSQNINTNILSPDNFLLTTPVNISSQKLTFKDYQDEKLKIFEKRIKGKQIRFFLKSLCAFGELKMLNKFR